MSPDRFAPKISWYDSNDLSKSIRQALDKQVSTERIAEQLCKRKFGDAHRSQLEAVVTKMNNGGFSNIRQPRLEAIIESLPESTGEDEELPTSQPSSVDVTPRSPLTNRCAVSDFAYLSSREAARIIGLVLELFDGNTVRLTEEKGVETDLLWRRQHASIAIRVIPTRTVVSDEHPTAVANGPAVPSSIQSPSELAIVTCGKFSDEATRVAKEHDIHCYNAGHVEAWLRRAKISQETLGTVLEDGEAHDGPLTELVDASPIPSLEKKLDPFDLPPAFSTEELDTSETSHVSAERVVNDTTGGQRDVKNTVEDESSTGSPPVNNATPAQSDTLVENQPIAGKKGVLYADPGEDGDYSAFDDYLEDIE